VLDGQSSNHSNTMLWFPPDPVDEPDWSRRAIFNLMIDKDIAPKNACGDFKRCLLR
jgi:hypothetical protein